MDTSELTAVLAREEWHCKPPGSCAAPLQPGRPQDLGPATGWTGHLRLLARVIHFFFLCKYTHICVNEYVISLVMYVTSVCMYCLCLATHWEQLLSFATGRTSGYTATAASHIWGYLILLPLTD